MVLPLRGSRPALYLAQLAAPHVAQHVAQLVSCAVISAALLCSAQRTCCGRLERPAGSAAAGLWRPESSSAESTAGRMVAIWLSYDYHMVTCGHIWAHMGV